jgi:hypothetical protein
MEHVVSYDLMYVLKKNRKMHFFEPIIAVVELCPNCARQGQIFPNISKRIQKLVENVE